MAYDVHYSKIKIGRHTKLAEDDEFIYPGEIVIALDEDDTTIIGIKAGFGDEEHIDAEYSINNDTPDGLARPMQGSNYSKLPFVTCPWKIIGTPPQPTPDPAPDPTPTPDTP